MKSEDTGLLATITGALNNLRSQGTPIGVDVRLVTVQIHDTPAVRFAWNDVNADWDISAD